jgi:ATP-dependent phosphofructokinase / diphosphate-dependent phosphofructokinase
MSKRVGIVTAGGDCPGLNAVIRAVVKAALRKTPALEIVGILDGYSGLVEDRTRPLDDSDVSGILIRGGTILGTSNRDNPFRYLAPGSRTPEDRSKEALATVERHRLDGLIAVGGDGTLRGALAFQKLGLPVVGVPKTIDNDLSGTDITFGFDSALGVATAAVDRLHSTAESHHRILICEVMGRNAGWIALRAGIAGGGDVILLPEIPYDIQKIVDSIRDRERRGKNFSIMVVAEGAKPVGGAMVSQGQHKDAENRPRLGGISHSIAQPLEEMTGDEARVVILGHLQRGGSPSPYDRWLATQFGTHAADLAAAGQWGRMVSLQGTRFSSVSIEDAVRHPRLVDPAGDEVQSARALGTSFGD